MPVLVRCLVLPILAVSVLEAQRGAALKKELRLTPAGFGAPPTALRAGPTPTSIRLTWTCPPGATGYEVYATPKGGATVKLTPTPITLQCYQDLSGSIQRDPRVPAPVQATYLSSFTHTGLAPGAEFAYVVRALHPDATGDSDPLTAVTSLWPAPAGFMVSLAGRAATVRWNQVAGPSGYLVFRKSNGQTAFQQVAAVPPSATSYNDPTTLPPGQHGYYVQGVSGEPSIVSSVSLPAWPAPAGFGVTLAARVASLVWAPIVGAPGHLVFRKLQGQPGFQQIAALAPGAGSFQDPGLPLGSHQYFVQALQGDPSPTVAVVAGRPTNVAVSIYRGKGTVDFSWGGTDDANTMVLMRAPSPGGPFIDVTKKGNTARNQWARDDAAQVGATQYYKIVAVYIPGGGMESEVLPAAIPIGPQGITNLTATSPGPGTVKLKWTCDPEAIGYGALRGKGNEAMDWIPFTMTQPCEFVDTGLWNGATYRYTVTGRYPDRNTSTSAGVSVALTP